MRVRVAIHDRPGFGTRWRERLEVQNSECEVVSVDCFGPDAIARLRECDALLWHLSHDSQRDFTFADGVLRAADAMGLHVHPNEASRYHFDDKVAQTHLLQAIGAPQPRTWVFYSRVEALEFLESAEIPIVFKLRRGAGSKNVRLVRSRSEGRGLVEEMFGRGLAPARAMESLGRTVRAARGKKRSLKETVRKGIRGLQAVLSQQSDTPRERGYVLMQQFLPGNERDVRITVIGERAFLFHRRVRPGDFRASGSGLIEYPKTMGADVEAVEVAMKVSERLGFDSMAYDFVVDASSGRYVILEMSYVFAATAVYGCEGHFDRGLKWMPGKMWPEHAIADDVVSRLRTRERNTGRLGL